MNNSLTYGNHNITFFRRCPLLSGIEPRGVGAKLYTTDQRYTLALIHE